MIITSYNKYYVNLNNMSTFDFGMEGTPPMPPLFIYINPLAKMCNFLK